MPEKLTNTAMVQDYLDHMVKLGRRPSTVYSYATTYRKLVAHLGRHSLLIVTTADLYVFCLGDLERGAAGTQRSASSRKARMVMLRSLFKYLVNVRQLRLDNPALGLELPTVDNERPHPASDADWIALWRSDLSDADRVAFGLAYFAGLRRFEVTSLAPWNVEDVPALTLVNFVRKGGKVTRSFPLGSCLAVFAARRPDLLGSSDVFIGALERLRASRGASATLLPWSEERDRRFVHPYVYEQNPNHVNPDLYNRRLERACTTAGLPTPIRPHDLRHSYCTNMLAMLGEQHVVKVSRLANHADVRVTMRYLHTAEDPLIGVLDDHEESLRFTRFG